LPEQDCLLCAGRARGAVICPACEAALPLLASARCVRCAIPVPSAGICGECLARPPAFDDADAVYAYRFPLDRLVGRFKYAGDLAAGRWLAVRLAQRVRAHARPCWSRRRSAGTHARPRLQPVGRDRAGRRSHWGAVRTGAAQGARTICSRVCEGARARSNLRQAFRCPARAQASMAIVDDVIHDGRDCRRDRACSRRQARAA
jgi:predicted amidophosphoribosyltransferase